MFGVHWKDMPVWWTVHGQTPTQLFWRHGNILMWCDDACTLSGPVGESSSLMDSGREYTNMWKWVCCHYCVMTVNCAFVYVTTFLYIQWLCWLCLFLLHVNIFSYVGTEKPVIYKTCLRQSPVGKSVQLVFTESTSWREYQSDGQWKGVYQHVKVSVLPLLRDKHQHTSNCAFVYATTFLCVQWWCCLCLYMLHVNIFSYVGTEKPV